VKPATRQRSRIKDAATSLTDRAARWRLAADRLDKTAEQLGLLRAAILNAVRDAKAPDPLARMARFEVADDGMVSVAANKDGTGPAQYKSVRPDLVDEPTLAALDGYARLGAASAAAAGSDKADRLLNHFLDNSGSETPVSVDAMLKDMDKFRSNADGEALDTLTSARNGLPSGYTGPVIFQGEFSKTYRPDNTNNPDWFLALGNFSYKTSGIAVPSDNGGYTVSYRTSVYDYYNFDSTGWRPWPQVSNLNDLHIAGRAQNFDTVGTSSVRTFHRN